MSDRSRASLLFAIASVFLPVLTLLAAPVTWADPAGACAGHLPCFSTLGAAVANAGPPPATVFAFPGTYAESVDLDSMGSSVGGIPGELALISVDAAGLPAPGAIVDPAAPGGPGAGMGMQTLAFPALLTIDGFVLRSPDQHGLGIFATASVHLRRLVASGNANGTGVVVLLHPSVPATITADDLRGDGNGSMGLFLGAARVVATRLSASNNGDGGIALRGTEVTGQLLVAEGNGAEGVELVQADGAASFALTDVTVRGNGQGLVAFPEVSATTMSGSLNAVAAASNLGNGVVVFADRLTAAGLTATQNDRGMLLVLRESLDGSDLSAIGNAGYGIIANAPELRLSNSFAEDNLSGIAAIGDRVHLDTNTAVGNGPGGPEPMDGSGFAVFAQWLEGHGNRSTGNAVGWFFDDTDPFARPAFAHSLSQVPVARPRIAAEGALPSQQLTLRLTRTADNSAASMRVRLRDPGRLTAVCSDFVNNSPPGLDLLSNHVVDARANFWGSASGPLHPSNPAGLGDPIRDAANGGTGSVLFAGFLDGPAAQADCPVSSVLEVPALESLGLGLLAAALALAALTAMRRASAS